MNRLSSFLLLLVCSGCATSWPVYDRQLSLEQIREDEERSIPIVLAAKPAPETDFRRGWSVTPRDEWVKHDMQRSVSNLVSDLKQTGLFEAVIPWTPDARYDLLVEARRAGGIITCGTPFACRPFTLYLLSGESSYKRMYEFRFIALDGKRLEFEKSYTGTYYAPSVLFLPLLAWQKRTAAPDLLRHDLISLEEQIRMLKR